MITNTETKVSYTGDGIATSFAITFPFNEKDYVKAAIYDETTKITTVLTSDYYVDEEAKAVKYPGYAPGQEPEETARPAVLAATQQIIIYRETDVTQEVGLGEKYPLPYLEAMADKLTMIIQEMAEEIGRAIKTDISGTTTADELLESITESLNTAVKAAAGAEAAVQTAETAAETATAKAAEAAAKAEEVDSKIAGVPTESKINATIEQAIESAKDTFVEVVSEKQYAQVTKLDTVMLKGLLIPVEATSDYRRPPLEVLKLRDDGISTSVTACDFSNGDADDFSANDNIKFFGGTMKLKKKFEIAMTTPAALGLGYISESEEIDITQYVDPQEVRIA